MGAVFIEYDFTHSDRTREKFRMRRGKQTALDVNDPLIYDCSALLEFFMRFAFFSTAACMTC